MIIDFHTHIFPEKIAKRTIELLADRSNIKPHADGTVSNLLSEMKLAGADMAVTLPVVTNPAQFDSINRFARDVNDRFQNEQRRLISFAGIHPACEDIETKMSYIKDCGFLGVKIHPDYQDTFINDDRYADILRCAKKHDLIVVTHAGVDGAYRDRPVRCTPNRVIELIREIPHSKLVLAHCGANEMFEEVLDTLCGEDVYFDTAFILQYIDESTFKHILKKHGEDKILFASDSPWSSIHGDVEKIKSFNLGKETEEKIFYKNAKKLLNI